jgi:energy-converting hydrogenase Eha subunit E
MTTRLLLIGVCLIFGGEAFCVFGPHERIVDVGCHAVLYAGIFLVAIGTVLEVRRRSRTPFKRLGGE